eukprot:jgi/Botrbrau1/14778/Bobra.0284s0011.1
MEEVKQEAQSEVYLRASLGIPADVHKDVLPTFHCPCQGSTSLSTDKCFDSNEYIALYRLPSKGERALAIEILNWPLVVLLKSKETHEDMGILELDLLPLASGSSTVSQEVYTKQVGTGECVNGSELCNLQGPWLLRVRTQDKIMFRHLCMHFGRPAMPFHASTWHAK